MMFVCLFVCLFVVFWWNSYSRRQSCNLEFLAHEISNHPRLQVWALRILFGLRKNIFFSYILTLKKIWKFQFSLSLTKCNLCIGNGCDSKRRRCWLMICSSLYPFLSHRIDGHRATREWRYRLTLFRRPIERRPDIPKIFRRCQFAFR